MTTHIEKAHSKLNADDFQKNLEKFDDFIDLFIANEKEKELDRKETELVYSLLGIKNTNFEDADHAFSITSDFISKCTCKLMELIRKQNISELLIYGTLYMGKLSLISGMNLHTDQLTSLGSSDYLKTSFPIITSAINENHSDSLRLLIGSQTALLKRGLDITYNGALKIYNSELETEETTAHLNYTDFLDILYTSIILSIWYEIKNAINNIGNVNKTLSIVNSRIDYSNIPGNYEMRKNGSEMYTFDLDESSKQILWAIYEENDGFNPIQLAKFPAMLNQAFGIASKRDFCKIISQIDGITLKGAYAAFNKLILSPPEDTLDILSNKNKLSRLPFTQLEDDFFLVGQDLFFSGLVLLMDRMTDENFSENKRTRKKIQRFYSENFISKISKELNANGVWHQPSYNFLKSIRSKKTKKDFNSKGVTKEIDLVLFDTYSNTSILVEYKNWGRKAYDLTRTSKEKNKALKMITDHVSMLNLIEEHKEIGRAHV